MEILKNYPLLVILISIVPFLSIVIKIYELGTARVKASINNLVDARNACSKSDYALKDIVNAQLEQKILKNATGINIVETKKRKEVIEYLRKNPDDTVIIKNIVKFFKVENKKFYESYQIFNIITTFYYKVMIILLFLLIATILYFMETLNLQNYIDGYMYLGLLDCLLIFYIYTLKINLLPLKNMRNRDFFENKTKLHNFVTNSKILKYLA